MPAIEAKYRQLDRWGAFQIGGFLTYGTIESIDPDVTSTKKGVRAYFEANGKAQLDPLWSITTSLRVASDKTVTRRYDITNDDRLRNVVNAERIDPDSTSPLPDGRSRASGRRRSEADPDRPSGDRRALHDGGSSSAARSSCKGTASSILRIEGQDTQRAFASANGIFDG